MWQASAVANQKLKNFAYISAKRRANVVPQTG
jgi:hypothetical protein